MPAARHEDDLGVLKLNIQKRHIIGHNLGVMDDRFAIHAQDARVGETVTLVADEVREFASLGQRVGWGAGAEEGADNGTKPGWAGRSPQGRLATDAGVGGCGPRDDRHGRNR